MTARDTLARIWLAAWTPLGLLLRKIIGNDGPTPPQKGK